MIGYHRVVDDFDAIARTVPELEARCLLLTADGPVFSAGYDIGNMRVELQSRLASLGRAAFQTLLFAMLVLVGMGYDKMLEFVTGYTLEKSLSVDNMFVFLLIFSTLAIPHKYQHKVLTVGILSAIAMRIPLILAGVTLLETFHWMIYLFGGLLVVTAIRMLFQKKEKKVDLERNIAVRLLRKVVPISSELNGDKFFARKAGILFATPMLVSLVIVEMTDLVFAIDSIPAVLAITSDPFIVITSNIFAILGLRSLYFLLAGMMEKFYYLKPALVALLLFVGVKMMIVDFVKVPISISLMVIGGILATALVLSYAKTRQEHGDSGQVAINSRDDFGVGDK